jgi:hypothetical protein
MHDSVQLAYYSRRELQERTAEALATNAAAKAAHAELARAYARLKAKMIILGDFPEGYPYQGMTQALTA